jgi:molybdopterin-guanine dinucleotide biosynthesis protein A
MVTGVILAGGRNSRMHGYNKALLPFQGEKLIERQVRVMRTICEEIIIVTPSPALYTELLKGEAVYMPDVYVGHGPLSGIHAAFSKIETEYAWVVGCDYPYLSTQATQLMLDCCQNSEYDVIIPIISGNHQMLHGVYRPKALLNPIMRLIESKQYRLSGLLDVVKWLGIEESDWRANGISLDFTLDCDTPEQYLNMLRD